MIRITGGKFKQKKLASINDFVRPTSSLKREAFFSIIESYAIKNSIELYKNKILMETAYSTTKITSMVFIILIGATFFSLVFRGLGGDETIEGLLTSIPGGIIGAVIAVMITMFILGFFLDFIEITFVVVPIVAPILFKMGIDPIWLGVMMAINLKEV